MGSTERIDEKGDRVRIRLFCSDLDGTLVGNPEGSARFERAWQGIERERPLLVYSTGRLHQDARKTIDEAHLPPPDFLISGVGTSIVRSDGDAPLQEYNDQFESTYDRRVVEEVLAGLPDVERQPPEFHHPYKSSWYLYDASKQRLEEIEERLRERGLNVSIVYSSNRDLDVLPAQVDKGRALAWLCESLGIPTSEVLVAGDSGNDAAMFRLDRVRGIIVGNAQPELLTAVVGQEAYRASSVLADGVVEGLKHFELIDTLPDVHAEADSNLAETDPEIRSLFNASAIRPISQKERDVIRTGYEHALDALRRNITPAGFSACSLDDNEVIGTDINYRSVWGRDGAITVNSVIHLEDDDVRAACRTTLQTLFDHTSPTGQVPANVRIDTGEPDYSGIGGIAAIDSGLWAVIAFYDYVHQTGDLDFLREYHPRLQRTIDWLSAHDSNNDGLLEIPEAGDWTDLFGRSYNVLYDEVLWYRTIVCYAMMLEMLDLDEQAADYFRWSERIRTTLITRFWPRTARTEETPGSITFAEMQYSIGDTSYLLAEITPFGFSWRCDVFGNILAYLTGLLDVDRARRAFRYMWGVGVNEPYPVTNLYPTVQAGDPDWRNYYTVNMLNLPYHYHNGGIWPFVGGMWVRFIQQLGLYDVAARELYRLAELNRTGTREIWEFNEWAHGVTGRPMGKRYQAWSAATYIRACHELGILPDEK